MLAWLRKIRCALARAWFADIPFLIDSRWRHIEYALNAECCYRPGAQPTIAPRRFCCKPPFWMFAVTVFYVAYGPTWSGLCAVLPAPFGSWARAGIGGLIVLVSAVLGLVLLWTERGAIKARFKHQPPLAEEWFAPRWFMVWVALLVGVVLLTALGVIGGVYVMQSGEEACVGGNALAIEQLGLCVAAVVVFALIAWLANGRAAAVVYAQAAILAVVALVQWFVLATDTATEAAHLPYRHVFAFWAPCIVAVLALAPAIARWVFCGLDPATADRFRALLPMTELFVNRGEPVLTGARIVYATVYGPVYHVLHLLVLPALVALTAPAAYLDLLTAVALFISAWLLIWGSVSSRWQELVIYIERWFLRGAPLFISLFVILIAILRVAQFEYVSTLLDAAPFGTTFGLVAMTYVLFWLTEYWLSRIVATHLLAMLRQPQDSGRIAAYGIDYPFPRDPAHPADPNDPGRIKVHRKDRYLATHGTGRFMAIGTVAELDGDEPILFDGRPMRAFQPYYLVDLFARLGEHTGLRGDHDNVSTIKRLTGVYFLCLNLLMIAVTAGFAVSFWCHHYVRNNGILPVVTAAAAPPPADKLVDLPGLLQAQAKAHRPAVVVIASGGGTRAALYTESVLHGLHCLGVDGDVVLISGVSGGGVGLAYFAAHHDALTAHDAGPPAGCAAGNDAAAAGGAWGTFATSVTQPFIEDVLNGATEWRIFRTTSLSALLVESFQRDMFADNPTLGSLRASANAPALILNAAMVGHPEEESAVLWRTLDAYPDGKCAEAERTFSLLTGGRLVFTNLADVDQFPRTPQPGPALDLQTDPQQPIPDVRLPYRIVRAPDVPLAQAAALNANFPPVFPNARVRITGGYPAPCPDRSFYATDGGAEENLGLVSALYALKSALARMPAGSVPEIHLVIAEASAVAYDYSDDRGLSVLLGTARERLAGGLANELIVDVNHQLDGLGAPHLRPHYLALPLAFRARGGFGTHWLYAKEFRLNDPRPRQPPSRLELPSALLGSEQAVLDRKDLEAMWNALHVRAPFCDPKAKAFPTPDMNKVREWICGADGRPRDLHIDEWKGLVEALGSQGTP